MSNWTWQKCDCAQVRRGRKEIGPRHTSNSFKTSALPIKKRKGKGDETNAVLTYLKESEQA